MIVFSLLYQLLIGPLELFFEVIFTIAYRFIGNAGLSIIFLSLAMNFLVLPLYRRADAMQEEERDRAAKMKPWLDHIKKTFSGDERFMMQQAYYRQCGYKQTDALKGSVSLLLEIPFFIAAYHFLSNLELLRGVPFGPIADLGAPDALLQFGDLSVNLLPLLMTLINVIAAAIYMKGFPLKSKVQMYGIAVIFLVLLYASPAGLVFYWTLNNVFSLVKNIFYKLKNPKLVLSVLASVVGVALIGFVLIAHPFDSLLKHAFVGGCGVLLQLPIVLHALGPRLPKLDIPEATKSDDRAFLLGCVFLALLTGLLIPCTVISSSPTEFVDATSYSSPIWYVVDALMLALGTFVVWFGAFYRLATPRGRMLFSCILWIVSGVAVVNYLFFGTDFGTMSPLLQFDVAPSISVVSMLVNLVAVALVAGALYAVWRFKRGVAKVAWASLAVAIAVMSMVNIMSIHEGLEPVCAAVEAANAEAAENAAVRDTASAAADAAGGGEAGDAGDAGGADGAGDAGGATDARADAATDAGGAADARADAATGASTDSSVDALPHFTMSKQGRNVVVIMLDRAMSYYLPYLMHEKPELEKMLAGFTYYPNCVSYGAFTNVGSPGLYGGYEYTPEKINARSDDSLREKQNEALKVMPVLFSENGFNTTIFDPTYAGYSTYPDLSVFNDYPEIRKYITMNGSFVDEDLHIQSESTEKDSRLSRNFFCYSLFKTAPLVLQPTLYDAGNYNSSAALSPDDDMAGLQVTDGVSRGFGIDPAFAKSYSVLDKLPDITRISEGDDDNFLMMSNDTTHEAVVLREPEYALEPVVDNTEYDQAHEKRYADDGSFVDFAGDTADRGLSKTLHYECNMAAFLKLGEWFDYLRANDVFDNTRIIIVSDHARNLQLNADLVMPPEGTPADEVGNWDMMMFNCMLMMKDFGAEEFSTSRDFMTNADTPTLAFAGVVDNPVNPSTGNAIDASEKANGDVHVFWPDVFSIVVSKGNTFSPGRWFSVHDNALDPNNWEYLGSR